MITAITNVKIYIAPDHFESTLIFKDDTILGYDLSAQTVDKCIDLGGKTVIPGFNDAHLHLASVGKFMSTCDLSGAKSIQEVIAIGNDYYKNNPTQCLQGRGWNPEQFTSGEKRNLTRDDLDQITTEIPIVFTRVCGHLAVGNTAALEMLNINGPTPVVEGEVLLDENQLPTGVFTENAVRLLQSLIPAPTNADRTNYLENAMAHAVSLGVTSVQSCDIMDPSDVPYFKVLKEMHAMGKMLLRYSHQFNYQDPSDFEHHLKTEFLSDGYDEKWLSKGLLKLFKDGSLGARTALMSKPYADDPSTIGVDALLDNRLKQLIQMADQKGIGVIVHVIGDAALEAVLNAFEPYTSSGNPLGHGLVHCQISRPDQLNRIKAYDLKVYFQPIFIANDHKIVSSRVGSHLLASSYANKTLSALGVTVAFSTDAPVEPMNPFNNLYYAVTRRTDSGEVFLKDQCLSLYEALDAYTIESAKAEMKAHIKGRLLPGYLADFAVLDQDIFSIPIDALPKTLVLETYVGGKSVYVR